MPAPRQPDQPGDRIGEAIRAGVVGTAVWSAHQRTPGPPAAQRGLRAFEPVPLSQLSTGTPSPVMLDRSAPGVQPRRSRTASCVTGSRGSAGGSRVSTSTITRDTPRCRSRSPRSGHAGRAAARRDHQGARWQRGPRYAVQVRGGLARRSGRRTPFPRSGRSACCRAGGHHLSTARDPMPTRSPNSQVGGGQARRAADREVKGGVAGRPDIGECVDHDHQVGGPQGRSLVDVRLAQPACHRPVQVAQPVAGLVTANAGDSMPAPDAVAVCSPIRRSRSAGNRVAGRAVGAGRPRPARAGASGSPGSSRRCTWPSRCRAGGGPRHAAGAPSGRWPAARPRPPGSPGHR